MKLIAVVLAGLVALAFVVRIRSDYVPPANGGNEVTEADGDDDAMKRNAVVIVENVAIAGTKDEVDQAVDDLKTIGLWDDLTDKLYKTRISVQPHVSDIPDDGHLAHAYLTGIVEGEQSGALCDITFYPSAMRRSLRIYRENQVETPDLIPTNRQFWASILGHELSHCLGDGQGENVAQAWEREVFQRLEARGIE